MSNDVEHNSEALKRTRRGQVVSDKRDKTRTVTIEYLRKLPKIGKYVKQRSVFHVHDERNASHRGDWVEIVPCRPLSKTKSWRLVRVLEQAPQGSKGTSQPDVAPPVEAGAPAGGEQE